ncbi:MAG TPA: hypothetical protein VLP30_04125, partial [Desulfatirhabdiaceae bacterium]|nr:hypothetical protein [Desulfatirhabdiaceae bacterium]
MANDGNRLRLYAPNARQVVLMSSLNQYKGVGMQQDTCGTWEMLVPSDKDFTYFFNVDGTNMLND